MSKAKRVVRSVITMVALATLAVVTAAANGAEPKFRAAPGSEPVIGHYLVRLDESVSDDAARAAAEGLARTYGGQLEIYASSDVRRFAIVMLPARARTLSADPRVREVVGIAQGDDVAAPPQAAAATLARHLVPNALDSSSSGTYLYDGSGSIKSIGSDTFSYDVNGRLANATVLGNQQTFTYDPFGNRLTAVRATGAVGCVGGCDIAVTVSQQNNHVSGLTYDDAGNVTATAGASYSFDGTGMVTRAIVGSDVRDFLYTADDERIAIRKGASWTWSVRDLGGKVLREFTSLETSSPFSLSQHTWSKDYVWRDGQLLASVFPTTEGTISPRTTYHYHLDHLGTPRLITKELGVLVGKHTYYAYGAEMDLTPKESATELMKFTGHERDMVAGDGNSVDYMHARYYSPSVGRFLSVDPVLNIKRAMGHPQAWNRYSYGGSNPVNRLDPAGADDISVSLGMVFAHLSTFFAGAGRGVQDATGITPMGRNTAESRTPEFQMARSASKAATEFLMTHDIVIEGSVNVGAGAFGTAGLATVNGNDPYLFFGAGSSYSVSPASMTISIGTVQNYQGVGSYGGFYTSVSGPQPAGLTIAGNPFNPKGPVALTFSASTDLGLVSQSATYYVPLSSLSPDIQERLTTKGAAYVFIQGQLYTATPQ